MPDRSLKMKRRIFGFQRRVWWPKWTPASRRSRMEATAIEIAPFSVELVLLRTGLGAHRLQKPAPAPRLDPPGRGTGRRKSSGEPRTAPCRAPVGVSAGVGDVVAAARDVPERRGAALPSRAERNWSSPKRGAGRDRSSCGRGPRRASGRPRRGRRSGSRAGSASPGAAARPSRRRRRPRTSSRSSGRRVSCQRPPDGLTVAIVDSFVAPNARPLIVTAPPAGPAAPLSTVCEP